MEEAIKTTANCYQVCLKTINHCLSMGGKHAEEKHIKLLMDCAKICATTVDFMARNSEFHSDVCGVCAKVCEACADSCEKLEGKEMEECAKACRECAEVCEKMSS